MKKTLFRYPFILLCLLGKQLAAGKALPIPQNQNNTGDTSRTLATLHIFGVKYPSFFSGSKFSHIDSSIINRYEQGNLSQILSNQSQIFMKSYGPGMLSTPGFRGGNAAHTAVIWNGFNLQNPMNGQIDFSLIPAFLLNHVSIQYGSPAALFGSGTLGGAIHLQTGANLHSKQELEIMAGVGSFGMYSSGVKYFLNEKKWSMLQKVYWQHAENNFTYKAIDQLQPQYGTPVSPDGQPIQKITHASYQTLAWLQEYELKLNHGQKVGIKTWLQENNREIPSPLYTTNKEGIQKDKSAKIIGDYQFQKRMYELQARAGLLHDEIAYSDINTATSTSVSNNQTIYLDQFFNKEKYQLQFSAMAQWINATLIEQNILWNQNRYAIYGTLKWSFFQQKWKQQITLRQEWVAGAPIPFIPAYGFNLGINKNWTLFGNISRSYRLPTFNDLYWPEMGNPNLLPEKGWNEELSISNHYSKDKFAFHSTLTAFNKNINNWIVWLPVAGNLSQPNNVYKVWSRGAELNWKMQWAKGPFYIGLSGLHDYTLASNESSTIPNDGALHKQLIYTPKLKHRMELRVLIKKFEVSYNFQYTGARFVATDESSWLNSYHYSGINLGYLFYIKKKEDSIRFSLNNMTNQTYQVMVNRPMPLINYQLTLNLTF